MDSYWFFLLMSSAAIITPGPGVILTISNAARFGVVGAFQSILGIACGTFIVAGVSATSLAIVFETSMMAFNLLKLAGAAYLIYLGVKMWPSEGQLVQAHTDEACNGSLFIEGLVLQLSNPKAILFFLSIFPQFINLNDNYSRQFILLVTSYSMTVILIHMMYAVFTAYVAKQMHNTFKSTFRRIGSGLYVALGIGVAVSDR